MYFDKFQNLQVSYISKHSGGFIAKNQNILNNLKLNKLTRYILEKSVYGTLLFKLGNKGSKILLISGVHGNELPPQIAHVQLLNKLSNKKLNHTIYFIPFASPKSTMNNQRTLNSRDLNRSAHIKNSISNLILNFAINEGVKFIADFHSTAYNSNPGREAIFSSKYPTPESFIIANHISQKLGSDIIFFEMAGSSYKGAIEDVSNLRGIPAITAEVLSPFSKVAQGSVEKSFAQMKSFLDYFGI